MASSLACRVATVIGFETMAAETIDEASGGTTGAMGLFLGRRLGGILLGCAFDAFDETTGAMV